MLPLRVRASLGAMIIKWCSIFQIFKAGASPSDCLMSFRTLMWGLIKAFSELEVKEFILLKISGYSSWNADSKDSLDTHHPSISAIVFYLKNESSVHTELMTARFFFWSVNISISIYRRISECPYLFSHANHVLLILLGWLVMGGK